MPPIGPISRKDLIEKLRKVGFDGPHVGTRHPFMSKGTLKVRIPNPHGKDIGVALLGEILRQAEISREDWKKL